VRYLDLREHDREPLRPLRTHDGVDLSELAPQHLSIEEDERVQRLVLSRGRDPPASALRESLTSAEPISSGCRLLWKRMNRRVHWT